MVAWLSHGGTLIRAAPEHLRMATSLETRTYDILQEASLLNHKTWQDPNMWTSEHLPRRLKKELPPTCRLMNHPRWIRRLMPDHPRIEIQVWYLVPRTPDVTERNQMWRDPLVGLPTMLLRIHQAHHPLPHQKANQSHKGQQSNDQLYLRPLKGDQVCHPVPKLHNDHRLYHQSD